MAEDDVHVVLGEQDGHALGSRACRPQAASGRAARRAPCRRWARPSAAGGGGWRVPPRARGASGRRRPGGRSGGRRGRAMPTRSRSASASSRWSGAARGRRASRRRCFDEQRHLDVLGRGEGGQGLRDLEGPPDAEAPDAAGRPAGDVAAQHPTRPPSGRSWPISMLKQVLLPAPFGPIRATTSPAATARSTPATAATPPKRLARPSAARTGSKPQASAARRPRRPASPWGKARTRRMMVRPSSRRQSWKRERAVSRSV